MTLNEELAGRVRAALARVRHVEEKKMFGSIAFMVNKKMCVTVGHDRLMCRIDPELHDAALQRPGARTVKMKGRAYKGFVYVSGESLKSKSDLDYWLKLARAFNKRAKSSGQRTRRDPRTSL
ncbi:MAG: TfoX/Sxy family protein [Ignavibacteriae bacterium]|nr:TfoX/Sxy family protein [Ignavibacteriota bacterium]